MNPLRIFLNIVEIRTKAVSIAVFVFVSLSAAVLLKSEYQAFPWVNWWLMLAATLAVDMGTTGFNNYFDFLHGVDRRENNFEAEKVLLHRGVSPARAFYAASILFLTAVVLGLIIAVRTSWVIAPIGAVCMLAGFFYSAGPKPISDTPLGEFFAGAFLGLMLFCISWFVLTGSFSIQPVFYSLPLSLMISGILTVNNNCDMDNDRNAGRKTITVLAGRRTGIILLYVEYAAAMVLLLLMQFVFGIYPEGMIFITAAIIAVMILMFFRMHKRGFSALTKGASMNSILKIYLLGTLVLSYPMLIELLK